MMRRIVFICAFFAIAGRYVFVANVWVLAIVVSFDDQTRTVASNVRHVTECSRGTRRRSLSCAPSIRSRGCRERALYSFESCLLGAFAHVSLGSLAAAWIYRSVRCILTSRSAM